MKELMTGMAEFFDKFFYGPFLLFELGLFFLLISLVVFAQNFYYLIHWSKNFVGSSPNEVFLAIFVFIVISFLGFGSSFIWYKSRCARTA